MMKLGSLFAGIGAFDLGFENQGFEVAWQVEWDPHAQRVLRHHWPDVPLYGDIREVDPRDLEWVDVITFGSPCQDLSVANTKREGLSGERSGLFHEAVRIIKHLQPRFAVWENVPGAFSSNRGWDFAAALAALVDAGATDVGWRVLDAKGFGVPQRRRRIFLVADFGGERAGDILALGKSVPGYPRPYPQEGQDAATFAGDDPGDADRAAFLKPHGFYHTDRQPWAALYEDQAPCLKSNGSGAIVQAFSLRGRKGGAMPEMEPDGVPCLRDGSGGGSSHPYVAVIGFDCKSSNAAAQPEEAPTLRSMNFKDSHINGGGMAAVAVIQNTTRGKSQNGIGISTEDAMYTLDTISQHGVATAIDFRHAALAGDTTITLQSKNQGGYSLNYGPGAIIDGIARRLTPREWERLMAFPDDWTAVLTEKGKVVADSHRYRQLGNSVAVCVVEQLAANIAVALRDEP